MANTTANSTPGELLRGFEVVRLSRFTGEWETVSRWRPTILAANQAAADCKWHRERHPDNQYMMVSLVAVFPSRSAGVLQMEADLIESRVENGAYDVAEQETKDE